MPIYSVVVTAKKELHLHQIMIFHTTSREQLLCSECIGFS